MEYLRITDKIGPKYRETRESEIELVEKGRRVVGFKLVNGRF